LPSVVDRFLAQAFRACVACLWLVLGLLPLAVPAGAAAAVTAEPALELSVHRVVVDAQGVERLQPADAARAGDVLEYRAVYVNSTAKPIRGAQVTLPVPAAGVEYRLDSATPAAALASSDGRLFATVPLLQPQPGPDGKPVLRPAPASAYRFLRWQLGDLAPGASRTVHARVRLTPVGAAR
jgi:hypothetical protein